MKNDLTGSGLADRKPSPAAAIVRSLFQGCDGNLEVRLWDGATFRFGARPPEAALVFHHPRPLREAVLSGDPLRLLDAHFRGLIDIEGDIYAALRLERHFESLKLSPFGKLSILIQALLQPDPAFPEDGRQRPAPAPRSLRRRWFGTSTKNDNRNAIAFHYDVSNDFYRLWLDRNMVYSCAYFESAGDDLDEAQRNKLDHLCRKLRLKPGERLLDIGCGWGALICRAAGHYGVRAHGITLSRNQYEYARQAIREQGLEERATVELRDYRDFRDNAPFDKIVSVGMFEHVGLKNLPLYFGTAHRLLRPGGLFLNHGITHDREGWRETPSTRFINRYVFPDGELDTIGNVQRVMERCGFEIHDVEGLRPHYALTLRHWVRRLEQRRQEALRYVPENVYRVWRLYMAVCALHFEDGDIGVYQILASKRTPGARPVPLTRRDLYDRPVSA